MSVGTWAAGWACWAAAGGGEQLARVGEDQVAVEPLNPGEPVPSQLQPPLQVQIVTWVRENIHVKRKTDEKKR